MPDEAHGKVGEEGDDPRLLEVGAEQNEQEDVGAETPRGMPKIPSVVRYIYSAMSVTPYPLWAKTPGRWGPK